jgi:diguanylate cyclase (GGDEF)-like protein/PAS domain S-box-containing protein
VIGPLAAISQLVADNAGPAPFLDQAEQLGHGEFAQLSRAIAQTLTQLESTAQQLRAREQAFENLYQFAPAAMLSLDPSGQITEANHRAAHLLAVESKQALIGCQALDFIRPEDRALLRQTIDRLALEDDSRCELRVLSSGRTLDTLVECVGVRDEQGNLQRVRLALQDVTQIQQLQRQVADKSRLLNLLIDHMSDAIVLIDREGKIAAVNRQLGRLLHQSSEELLGRGYDPEHFWDEMNVLNTELFTGRLRQIEADSQRAAQERFEARSGTFLFQGIPVHDAAGQVIGRLWVVQEITPQEQRQKMLVHQGQQLEALRKLGQELGGVRDLGDLMERSASFLREILGAEIVGLALRRENDQTRSCQLIHRGTSPMLLSAHRAVINAVRKSLMPQTLTQRELMFWPELPRNLPWTEAFTAAGVTCLASAPLRGHAEGHGIIWVGRRGGERMEIHQLHLLEAMAPIVAARIEFAELREQLHRLEMTDPVTDLPNERQFRQLVVREQNRPGYPWSVLAIRLDHFGRINEQLGHAQANALLHRVAGALLGGLRKSSRVARLEGPTFGVLCASGDRAAAIVLAQRLLQLIAEQKFTLPHGTPMALSASIGLASCPEDGTDGPAAVALALSRAELAKRTGRDRVVAEGPADLRAAG